MKFSNEVVLTQKITYFKFPFNLFYCTTELRVHLGEPPRTHFYRSSEGKTPTPRAH